MSSGQYIIAALIILGWAVAAVIAMCIAKHNRKQTEKISQINKKNDLLAEVEELALLRWGGKCSGIHADAQIQSKIEKIRKIYASLSSMNGGNYELLVGELRQLITLDIENAAKCNAAALKAKEKAIRALIAKLESIPKKSF